MIRFKKLQVVLASVGLATLAVPQFARAGEIEDLKAIVQQLRAEVNQMKEQQKTAAAQPAAAAAPAATGSVMATQPSGVGPGIADAKSPTTFNVGAATFTLYGNADIYANYMRSSSGSTLSALEDGGIQRSRVGLKGERDVGDGYSMKFQLEQGVNLLNGVQADSSRLFDRQAWVGIKTPIGEFRAGRQNTAVFYRGGYIDFGSRTIGGVINFFGVPSRYDSDIAYISPRIGGFMFEAHYSLAGTKTNDSTNQNVYQLAVDYENGPYRVGYASVVGSPAKGSKYADKEVRYDNVYANYNYGRGKVYLAYVRSNNNTSTGSGTGLLNNGGTLLSNVGGQVAGTSADALNYYNVYQVSADYKVTPKLRVGGLYGVIDDTSGNGKNATGWAVGGFYDIFKETTVYAMVDQVNNDPKAGFRQAASAGLPTNFTTANDVNGRIINGVQLGVLYKF